MRRRVAVSVVLPVHNGAAFLRPSIESVLEQTCGDFELIVIDDGSTDATPELLAEYAARDRRVSIHRHETNQGLCPALNRGLAAATGRYIARQDADDVCFKGRLEVQRAYLDDHADVGLLGAGRVDVDARGLPARSCLYPPTDTGIRWRMLLHNPFCHTAMMFRRALLEREPEGYRAAYLYAEDYDLWTRLLKHTRGANLQEPLVFYRLHQASISMKLQTVQERLSTAIAAGQIAALGIDPPVTEPLVGRLRRWTADFPARIADEDLPLCASFLRILAAFGRQDGHDREVVARIQSCWLARIRSAAGEAAWSRLRAAGDAGGPSADPTAGDPNLETLLCPNPT